jgi:hypothetical protein
MGFVGIHLPKKSYKTGDTKSKKEAPAKYPVPVVKPERVSVVIGAGEDIRVSIRKRLNYKHAVLVREPAVCRIVHIPNHRFNTIGTAQVSIILC